MTGNFDSAEVVVGYLIAGLQSGKLPIDDPLPANASYYNHVFHETKRQIFQRVNVETRVMSNVISALRAENVPIPRSLLSVSIFERFSQKL